MKRMLQLPFARGSRSAAKAMRGPCARALSTGAVRPGHLWRSSV